MSRSTVTLASRAPDGTLQSRPTCWLKSNGLNLVGHEDIQTQAQHCQARWAHLEEAKRACEETHWCGGVTCDTGLSCPNRTGHQRFELRIAQREIEHPPPRHLLKARLKKPETNPIISWVMVEPSGAAGTCEDCCPTTWKVNAAVPPAAHPRPGNLTPVLQALQSLPSWMWLGGSNSTEYKLGESSPPASHPAGEPSLPTSRPAEN